MHVIKYENGSTPMNEPTVVILSATENQPEVTADTILSWLENDKGNQVFVFGKTWYTRLGSNSPHRKHPSLRAAVQFAMTDAYMLKSAAARKERQGI